MMRNNIRSLLNFIQRPISARAENCKDWFGLPSHDPGIDRTIGYAGEWLCTAQDRSASQDGGVAGYFSLVEGWATSYAETTGYIVPTMLAYARLYGDETLRHRAKRMLDWLVSIQFPDGGFQAGLIGARPIVPVTFNTGQILLGLASGVLAFQEPRYREAMCRAADWLVATQDADGCWRKHPTPFATEGEKVYETHVGWGLLEAERIEPGRGYAEAALANIRWALEWQHKNGWFEKCCLNNPTNPLTHTLGYALRGVVEGYRFSGDRGFLEAACQTADGLLSAMRKDGFLPGRLRSDWSGAVSWACLTGSVQIAHCWLLLYQMTGDVRYRDAAYALNRYVRRTIKVDGAVVTRGAVKGSFPVSGEYSAYRYLSWACKFFLDSNLLEKQTRGL